MRREQNHNGVCAFLTKMWWKRDQTWFWGMVPPLAGFTNPDETNGNLGLRGGGTIGLQLRVRVIFLEDSSYIGKNLIIFKKSAAGKVFRKRSSAWWIMSAFQIPHRRQFPAHPHTFLPPPTLKCQASPRHTSASPGWDWNCWPITAQRLPRQHFAEMARTSPSDSQIIIAPKCLAECTYYPWCLAVSACMHLEHNPPPIVAKTTCRCYLVRTLRGEKPQRKWSSSWAK